MIKCFATKLTALVAMATMVSVVSATVSAIDTQQSALLGDLLVGRGNQLRASSTCGQEQPQSVKLSIKTHGRSVIHCDSKSPDRSRDVQHVINAANDKKSTYDTWWMSAPGDESVTISIDFETTFTFTHLILVFMGYRPRAWWIERSTDNNTYTPYGYFASNCSEIFPSVRVGKRRQLDDVVCSTEYTGVQPADAAQAVFNAIPQHISELQLTHNSSSAARLKRQKQTDVTNLRIHFVRFQQFGGERSVAKQFYGLYEMNVHGMCKCHGHAKRCRPRHPWQRRKSNVVYGYCDCIHNTEGDHCQKCQQSHKDRPWSPGNSSSANECRQCSCHGHSDQCKFDHQQWLRTGSGGVCLNCQHSTTGVNCQRCRQGTYRDEKKMLEDPNICLPCKCSFSGTESTVCDTETDKNAGKFAGRCQCKQHVTGKMCNKCKPGYFLMQRHNPKGCRRCRCNMTGTINNAGCNQFDGTCQCKQNVEGYYCNRCKPGFFNFTQANPQGCSNCNCNIGGSTQPECGSNGLCKCKPGFYGRRCNKVQDGYFVPIANLSVAVVQAEDSGNSQNFPRVKNSQQPQQWADGVQVAAGADQLRIAVQESAQHLPGGNYQIAVRVLPITNVTVLFAVPAASTCGGGLVRRIFTSPADTQYQLVSLAACITTFTTFTVTVIDGAAVIDAVLIMKNVSNPLAGLQSGTNVTFEVTKKFSDNFINCAQFVQSDALPASCRDVLISISAYELPAAVPCDCLRGAENQNCDKLGGQCLCRPNVIGRRCSNCTQNHYGYANVSSSGCLPCNCSVSGSASLQCDSISGVCRCKSSRIDGTRCSRCHRGFWNFPTCSACACYGFATDCNQTTGACINCTHSTAGYNCSACKTGFYGDPLRGIQCRRCECPSQSVQHASSCQLATSGPVTAKCNCMPGYSGDSCQLCAVNHYGNATVGNCTRCSCHGNIDFSVPNSCDPNSGRCIKCTNHTSGYSCQKCSPGYYGNAVKGRCQQCSCNAQGTVAESQNLLLLKCDAETGKCHCKPNIIGGSCDRCLPNHFGINKGKGCQPCNCNKPGSVQQQCHMDTGSCACLAGFAGRKCDRCSDQYFGDPTAACHRCNCNRDGSYSSSCNIDTGQCSCKPGVTGRTCNKCERGTTGTLPNCTKCDDCWYSWNKILDQISTRAQNLRERAVRIANKGGLSDDLTDEINELNGTINNMWHVLHQFNVSDADVGDLQDQLTAFRQLSQAKLAQLQNRTNELKQQIGLIESQQVKTINVEVKRVNQKQQELQRDFEKLNNSATAHEFSSPFETLSKIEILQRNFSTEIGELNNVDQLLLQVQNINNNTNTTLHQLAIAVQTQNSHVTNITDDVTQRFQRVQGKLPWMTETMCIGYPGDGTVHSKSHGYCSLVCGGPASACNGTAPQCGKASICSNSVVGTLSSARVQLDSINQKISNAIRSSEQDKQNASQLNATAVTLSNTAQSIRLNVQQMQSSLQQMLQNSTALETSMRDLLKPDRIGLTDLQLLVANITDIDMPVSVAELQMLSSNIAALMYKLNGSKEMEQALADTKKIRETLQQLLPRARAAVNESQMQQQQAHAIAVELKAAQQQYGAAAANISAAEALMENEIHAANATMSQAVHNYANLSVIVSSQHQQLAREVQSSERRNLEINDGIRRVEREKNRTTILLDDALKKLRSISTEAAVDDMNMATVQAEQQQRRLQQLQQRLKQLQNHVGGDQAQLNEINSKLENLMQLMQNSAMRLQLLMDKLNGGNDNPESAAFIMSNIRKQHCGRI